MAQIRESDRIQGVRVVDLVAHGDARGRFIETFRKAWFPDRDLSRVQSNASYSRPGVLRGMHYHHHQFDYWFVPKGSIRVGLCDLRVSSPTFMATQTLEMGEDLPSGLFIPEGVGHGFVSLTDIVLTYLVDNYYDSADEMGVLWNDSDIGIDWGIASPSLSPRDSGNPRLKDIPPDRRPR